VELTAPGTYYLQVSNWLPWWSYWTTGYYGSGIPKGADYQLQVSLEGHSVDAFQFTPDPVLEQEGANNTSQSIDAAANWYVFADSTVGNRDYAGGTIDSLTPYAKVSGAGDGSWDVYEFVVTGEMLNPSAGSTGGVTSTGDFSKQGTVSLTGVSGAGDKWTLRVDGKDYTYTASASDGLAALAQKFSTLLPTATAGKDYTVSVAGDVLTVGLDNGFNFGSVTQEIQAAGTVTKTTKAVRQDGTTPVSFSAATLTLSASQVAVNETWSVVLGGTSYSYTTGGSDTAAEILVRS
jgi:hypothetical protein